jgi:hypothetical protein
MSGLQDDMVLEIDPGLVLLVVIDTVLMNCLLGRCRKRVRY